MKLLRTALHLLALAPLVPALVALREPRTAVRPSTLAPRMAVCDVADVEEATATASTLKGLVLTNAEGDEVPMESVMGSRSVVVFLRHLG